ncbi:hypothetical protein [Thermosipho sp. 1074]|uniref:hypothetical protein n=1 Tax=Thermosipho sp. 1074 TaxID=1643331 RepID=UPI00098695C6|nr:hypothetical protein [Thermosipho sp. 1074]OOC42778.1 hypothetical protein XO08_05985 [Thermosipho sp. 1074]
MQKFYLILITIFAFLFLFTFFSYEKIKNELNYSKKLNKAYEMYVNGDLRFEKYVNENNLNELKYLLERK